MWVQRSKTDGKDLDQNSARLMTLNDKNQPPLALLPWINTEISGSKTAGIPTHSAVGSRKLSGRK